MIEITIKSDIKRTAQDGTANNFLCMYMGGLIYMYACVIQKYTHTYIDLQDIVKYYDMTS